MSQPRDTTANPDWPHAESALDLVPHFGDPTGEADKFMRLVDAFTLTQGEAAGRSFGDVMLPWQRAAIRGMFLKTETFALLGKGSGKSVTAAAFAVSYCMYLALTGQATRGLICIVASSVATAKIIWSHALEGVLSDEELRVQFKSNVASKSLLHVASGIEIQVLPPSMDASVGRRPVLCIFDELHEFSKLRDADRIAAQLRMGGRNAGHAFKVISISTMPSGGPPVGEFERLLTYARSVRDGTVVDDRFLPLLFTFPVKERPDLDPLDPAQWWRAMPSLTTPEQSGTMDIGELERELRTAAEAEEQGTFMELLSQRLGIIASDLAEYSDSVLHARWSEVPASQAAPSRDADASVIGVDCGGLDDPLAVVHLWREGGRMAICSRQFLTQQGYDRAKASTRRVYDQAIEAGTLSVHGRVEDMDAATFDWINGRVRMVPGAWSIVGGDMHGRSGFRASIETACGAFVPVPQTYILGAALAQLEGLVADGRMVRNPDPLMDANIANTEIHESGAGNRTIRKRGAGLSGQGFRRRSTAWQPCWMR